MIPNRLDVFFWFRDDFFCGGIISINPKLFYGYKQLSDLVCWRDLI